MKCPRCGREGLDDHREWKYHIFNVKKFSCKKCDKAFMAYYKEGKLSHTIPKSKS